MRHHHPKPTRTRMGLPNLPRHPVPMRVRRQVQPVHRHKQNLHNTPAPNPERTLHKLQNTKPRPRSLLQELRNKTRNHPNLTTHPQNLPNFATEHPLLPASTPATKPAKIAQKHTRNLPKTSKTTSFPNETQSRTPEGAPIPSRIFLKQRETTTILTPNRNSPLPQPFTITGACQE